MKKTSADTRRELVLFAVGVVLIVLGVVCLVVAVVWHPAQDARLGKAAHEFFVALWPVFFTIAAGIIVYERWLRDSFVAELKRITGPTLIRTLRPRDTLGLLLSHVYGKHSENRDVVSGVLGGYGDAIDRTDLTISDATEVDMILVDTKSSDLYDLTLKVRYGFEQRQLPDTTFVFFVTSSPQLRDLILVGCERPLFDFWYVPDGGALQDLSTFTDSVKLEVTYAGDDGEPHETGVLPDVKLSEVGVAQWPQYLRCFREDIGNIRRLDEHKFESSLRIYTFSVAGVLNKHATFQWKFVRGFTISSTTKQKKSDEYCYWVAPYPCLVKAIRFNTALLTPMAGAGRTLEYRSVPFLLRAISDVDVWSKHPVALKPGAWLMPGHGVALLWRTDGVANERGG